MKDPERIDPLIEKVRKLWHLYPDMRLGQLIVNCTPGSFSCPEVFYMEDDKLERTLNNFLEVTDATLPAKTKSKRT